MFGEFYTELVFRFGDRFAFKLGPKKENDRGTDLYSRFRSKERK